MLGTSVYEEQYCLCFYAKRKRFQMVSSLNDDTWIMNMNINQVFEKVTQKCQVISRQTNIKNKHNDSEYAASTYVIPSTQSP